LPAGGHYRTSVLELEAALVADLSFDRHMCRRLCDKICKPFGTERYWPSGIITISGVDQLWARPKGRPSDIGSRSIWAQWWYSTTDWPPPIDYCAGAGSDKGCGMAARILRLFLLCSRLSHC